MKSLLSLVWLAFAVAAFGEGKFAVVRVTDIYRELPSTWALQEKIMAQRAKIMENQRAEQLRAVIVELRSIRGELQNAKGDTDTEQGEKLIRSYAIKRQEAEALRQELDRYRAEEKKRIDKFMVSEMRASLNRIMAAAERLAKERDLDGVFDISGKSNTGLPFVLYAGTADDVTEDVFEIIGEKQPEDESQAGSTEAAPAENQGQKE